MALVAAVISEVKDHWSNDAADALNMAEALFGVVLSVISMIYAIGDFEPGKWLMVVDIIGVALFATSSIVWLKFLSCPKLRMLIQTSVSMVCQRFWRQLQKPVSSTLHHTRC